MNLDLSTLVLTSGEHVSRERGVCAMEAVAWLAGEEHSDHPACTCPVLASYVRVLNDAMPAEARQRLVGLLPRLVGTAHDTTAPHRRAAVFAWAAVREFAPTALHVLGLHEEAIRLSKLRYSLRGAAPAVTIAARTARDLGAPCRAINVAIATVVDAAEAAALAAHCSIVIATDLAAARLAALAAVNAATTVRAADPDVAGVETAVWDAAIAALVRAIEV